MPLYCPNCTVLVEPGARQCSKCSALFGGEGWQPVPNIISKKALPSYGAWILFSPFIVVVAVALSLGVILGPAGPWLTPSFAPAAMALVWGLIMLHCWQASRALQGKERQAIRLRVGAAVLLCCSLLAYFTHRFAVGGAA